MYADRSSRTSFNPGSLGVAMGINAAVVAALIYAAPDIGFREPPLPPLETWNKPLDPPPPPPKQPEQPRVERRTTETVSQPQPERVDRSDPIAPFDGGPVFATGGGTVDPGPIAGTGTGPVDPPLPPPPVFVQPGIDPRYAADLQPTYPAAERRAGREGKVVVRVLVGTDGRVKRIEQVSAASDAFWRATEDRARTRWRFTPGTRDGVPVEAWRTLTLTFRLEG